MALTSINGPATVGNPGTATATRNPTYNDRGVIVGSSTPGGRPLPVNQTNRGIGRNLLRQLGLMNRADPRQNMSLTEEELRQAALMRLRGQ